MIRKTYVAITSCSMTVNVAHGGTDKDGNRKVQAIDFTGGNIELDIKGKFSTTDKALQDSLEASERFKNNYDICDVVEEPDPEGEADEAPVATDNLTPIGGSGTVQAAKLYLVNNYPDLKIGSLNTWAAIDTLAASIGIKFVR